jgi:hypothetical protein
VAGSSWGPRDHARLHRQQTLALQLFARQLTGTANGLTLLADFPLRGLFVVAAEFHLAENTFALHLLLQHPEGLVDIVVTDKNLHAAFLFDLAIDRSLATALSHWRTVIAQFGS